MNSAIKTREERIQNIIDAGHGEFYEIVKKRIIDAMKPAPRRLDQANTDFRAYVHEWMQTRKGCDIFGLGEVQTHPVVFQDGIMGIVARMKINNQKYVFKTMYRPASRYGIEESLIAFKYWREKGVSTPNIIASGTFPYEEKGQGRLHNIFYCIYPYIEITNKSSFSPNEIGTILGKMHQVTGTGYGSSIQEIDGGLLGDTKYDPLGPRIESTYEYLDRQGYIKTEDVKSIVQKATNMLYLGCEKNQSVLLHGDITKGNFLCGDTITVIDPVTKLGHPAEDIADYYLRNCISKDGTGGNNFYENHKFQVFLKAYQIVNKYQITEQELAAGICIQALRKLHIKKQLLVELDTFKDFTHLMATTADRYL